MGRPPREAIPTPDEMEDADSEPPYETIPSVPPNINIIANIEAVENFVSSTTAAVVNNNRFQGSRENLTAVNNSSITSNTADSVTSSNLPHDDSVISAHVDTGIYHLNKSRSVDSNPAPPTSSTSSIPNLQHHGNNVELMRKKLLMQDANETRL